MGKQEVFLSAPLPRMRSLCSASVGFLSLPDYFKSLFLHIICPFMGSATLTGVHFLSLAHTCPLPMQHSSWFPTVCWLMILHMMYDTCCFLCLEGALVLTSITSWTRPYHFSAMSQVASIGLLRELQFYLDFCSLD